MSLSLAAGHNACLLSGYFGRILLVLVALHLIYFHAYRFINDDGGFLPAAAMMRVWSEELWEKKWSSACDFGPMESAKYIGNGLRMPTHI